MREAPAVQGYQLHGDSAPNPVETFQGSGHHIWGPTSLGAHEGSLRVHSTLIFKKNLGLPLPCAYFPEIAWDGGSPTGPSFTTSIS